MATANVEQLPVLPVTDVVPKMVNLHGIIQHWSRLALLVTEKLPPTVSSSGKVVSKLTTPLRWKVKARLAGVKTPSAPTSLSKGAVRVLAARTRRNRPPVLVSSDKSTAAVALTSLSELLLFISKYRPTVVS